MPTSTSIVQRLWNYCSVLRDDGMSYGDYVEQLTYLLTDAWMRVGRLAQHIGPLSSHQPLLDAARAVAAVRRPVPVVGDDGKPIGIKLRQMIPDQYLHTPCKLSCILLVAFSGALKDLSVVRQLDLA